MPRVGGWDAFASRHCSLELHRQQHLYISPVRAGCTYFPLSRTAHMYICASLTHEHAHILTRTHLTRGCNWLSPALVDYLAIQSMHTPAGMQPYIRSSANMSLTPLPSCFDRSLPPYRRVSVHRCDSANTRFACPKLHPPPILVYR